MEFGGTAACSVPRVVVVANGGVGGCGGWGGWGNAKQPKQPCLPTSDGTVPRRQQTPSDGHLDGQHTRCVKSVFVVHVGGTRCVPSSTDNIMKIRARISLTVEFIRACIFLFLFYV